MDNATVQNIYFYLSFPQRGNEIIQFRTLSVGCIEICLPEAYLLNIMSENIRKERNVNFPKRI